MDKVLIIAEKPSVAADIAAALGGFEKKSEGGDTFFERGDCLVGSAVGHLAELTIPEGADPGFELSVLPVIPDRFSLAPRDDRSRAKLQGLKRLIGRPDVSAMVNACDAGREGELIFRYIYSILGCKKPFRRMWLQSMTPDSIRSGFKSLLPGEQKNDLFLAAQSRSEADFLIGINTTRALGKLHQLMTGEWDSQNGGRVAFPTLALIVDRENKIRNFKPRAYWEVHATFGAQAGDYKGIWFDPAFEAGTDEDARDNRFFDIERANVIAQKCRGVPASDVWEESKPVMKAPPLLFDLTQLQREANSKFGLSAAETLKIAQALYETHKVLTYPRTDAKALPEDYVETAKGVLQTYGGTSYAAYAREALENGWVKPNKRIFDNSKISDHFAIIPTGSVPSGLSAVEQKIYDLVVRRFIAAFFPSAEFLKTTRITTVEDEKFRSHGSVLKKPGWLAVYGKDADEDGDANLTPVADGERPQTKEVDVVSLKTTAPDRYNEATLLSAMEHAGRLVDDEALAEAMSERGLGTPATRAATIEKLLLSTPKHSPYLVREKKNLVPQEKAMKVIALLREIGVSQLTDPAMTGEWEFKLKQMEVGAFARGAFMEEIKAQTRDIINRIRERARTVVPPEVAVLGAPCPKCKGNVQVRPRTYECACGFKVWRELFGRAFKQSEVEQLFNEGKTAVLDGFLSTKHKPPKKFSAQLKLPEDLSKPIELVFPDRSGGGEGASSTQVVGQCPKCKSNVVARGDHYFCEKNTRENPGCDFRIWGELLGKKLTVKVVETLLSGKQTQEITGFISSKTNRTFSASLKMSADSKVELVFKK
ncbi:DNA topoisomerase [Burkholderia vietnamiensis]|uniref:DNA topoisomerase n=1 Tax=Burkholderia vietnamiensis TaxID=60552 RepID=UPI001CF15428|nr:DNA topoisomerase [Burkholderia vietnamiensis]MCA8228211.1 topoisomerase C-terminal repeat-containing protein [Burkholderia vietnamiensis]